MLSNQQKAPSEILASHQRVSKERGTKQSIALESVWTQRVSGLNKPFKGLPILFASAHFSKDFQLLAFAAQCKYFVRQSVTANA